MHKSKYIFIKKSLFFLLVISVQVIFSQTDQEIGFDETEFRNKLTLEGISLKEVEEAVFSQRNQLQYLYNLSQQQQQEVASPSLGCGNIGFQLNNFSEWGYQRGERTSGNLPIYNYDPVPFIIEGSGSSIFQAPYLDEAIDPNLQITLNDLIFSDFGANVIRLGSTNNKAWGEKITKEIRITEENRLLSYRYAIVVQNPGHEDDEQPFFNVRLEVDGQIIPCSQFTAVAPAEASDNIFGFTAVNPDPDNNADLYYRPTATNTIDLLDPAYGLALNDIVTIVVEVADCSETGHYGYAFFEGFCGSIDDVIDISSGISGNCAPAINQFTTSSDTFDEDPLWILKDSSGSILASQYTSQFSYTFEDAGEYLIELVINVPGQDQACIFSYEKVITIEDCECEQCTNCNSFSPIPGKKYVISAWVLEEHDQQQISYYNSGLQIQYLSDSGSEINAQNSNIFLPAGEIIDGWQRIMGEIVIPIATSEININLINQNSDINTFFDDIRIHPFNGNMKSFVYDQETQRLMAELDENNYATYYEYDNEGGLIRVKKETTKGVYTIQETRSGNSTLNNN